jgi:hypothetical protein
VLGKEQQHRMVLQLSTRRYVPEAAIRLSTMRRTTTMTRYVSPLSLQGLPLLTKAIGDNDYSVRIAGMGCGRILAKTIADGEVAWLWTITAPYVPLELQPSHGTAPSLEEAKTAFRVKFDQWLEWAKSLGHDVVWQD